MALQEKSNSHKANTIILPLFFFVLLDLKAKLWSKNSLKKISFKITKIYLFFLKEKEGSKANTLHPSKFAVISSLTLICFEIISKL